MSLIERGRRALTWARGLPVWVLDALVATAAVALGFASTSGQGMDGTIVYKAQDGLAYLLIVGATAPYYLRRRFPMSTFLVSTASVVLYAVLDYHPGGLPTLLLIGLYTIGAYCPPRLIVVGLAEMVVGLVIVFLAGVADFDVFDVLANSAIYTVAALFGWTVQARRLRVEALEQRAEALEREHEEEAKRVLADERLRIAQELHDVVAHSMSVIAVQAGVGAHVCDADPAEAKRALENISATSRSTLTELRRLLGVLREDEGGPYTPAPGLTELDALAHDVTEAGVPVEIEIEGSLDEVPPGVSFTGYRIVQEALTNVLKHAGPSSARVSLRHDDGALRIEVRDDGRGVNGRSTGGGHGLVGMRERVAVYGGTLTADSQPGGGFCVVATLPYSPSDRAAGAQ